MKTSLPFQTEVKLSRFETLKRNIPDTSNSHYEASLSFMLKSSPVERIAFDSFRENQFPPKTQGKTPLIFRVKNSIRLEECAQPRTTFSLHIF